MHKWQNHARNSTLFHRSDARRRRRILDSPKRNNLCQLEVSAGRMPQWQLIFGVRGFRHYRGGRRRCFQLVKLDLNLLPRLRITLGGIWRVRIAVKRQDICSHFRRGLSKLLIRQFVQKFRVGFIAQAVLAGSNRASRIKVIVDHLYVATWNLSQQFAVAIQRSVETVLKHFFRLWRWSPELEHSQWSNLGKQLGQERNKFLAGSRLFVILAPLLFITGTLQIVEKLL